MQRNSSHSCPLLPRRNSSYSSLPVTQGRGADAFKRAELILSTGKITMHLILRSHKLSFTFCKLLFTLITSLGLTATSCFCIFLTLMKGGEYSKPLPNG
ncbi:hypothetical protein AAY473_028048 [Plecturocebus cupreus]